MIKISSGSGDGELYIATEVICDIFSNGLKLFVKYVFSQTYSKW